MNSNFDDVENTLQNLEQIFAEFIQQGNILQAVAEAEWVEFDEHLVQPDYQLSEYNEMEEEDIGLELIVDKQFLSLTIAELQQANLQTDGSYWVEGYGRFRFIPKITLH